MPGKNPDAATARDREKPPSSQPILNFLCGQQKLCYRA
jgi:hypothetical protein